MWNALQRSASISVIATSILAIISFIISIVCIFIITTINKVTTINLGIVQLAVCVGVAFNFIVLYQLCCHHLSLMEQV